MSSVMQTSTACCRKAFLSRGLSASDSNSNQVLQRRCTGKRARSQSGTGCRGLSWPAGHRQAAFAVDRTESGGLHATQPRHEEGAMADADVIVVGGGLAGLVAATEIADAGKRVILLDQEGEQSLGGQAFWSFGGLFLVNSPE